MTEERVPPWAVPYPYGQAAAIDSMGSVASPLLAGFSITFAGLVVSTPHAFRWVSLTLALVLLAGSMLVGAMQFTFRARQWVATPSDIEQWFPDAETKARRIELRREQREHRMNFTKWSNLARRAYNCGIATLLLAIVVAMVPPDAISRGRYVVIAVALSAFLAEVSWIAYDEYRGRLSASAVP